MSYVVGSLGLAMKSTAQTSTVLRPSIIRHPIVLDALPSTTDMTGPAGASEDNTLPIHIAPDDRSVPQHLGPPMTSGGATGSSTDAKAGLPGWVLPVGIVAAILLLRR